MKQLKITVNGTTYDVLVEEVDATSAAPVAPASAPAPTTTPAPDVSASAEGEPVVAPMPGVILSVAVSQGNNVKKGDVLCTLEAMKMENEIYAPRDGVVSSVFVVKGESVESGKVLFTLS